MKFKIENEIKNKKKLKKNVDITAVNTKTKCKMK